MVSIKRPLFANHPSGFKGKKRRNQFAISSASCLEDLSNELFYEIFDYLDGYDTFHAFVNLNSRFENLLSCSSIPMKIDFGNHSTSSFEHRCRHLIIPNKHRLLSLHLRTETHIDEFFKYCILDSSFHRLESIILGQLTDYKLLWLLFYLNTLPRLSSLTLCLEEDAYYKLGDIYRLIFSLPALTYNKLSLFSYEDIDVKIPDVINEKFTLIRYLILDYPCATNHLTELLAHTPHVCYLMCERLIESDEHIQRKSLINLPHLRHIVIDECHIDFDEFEMLMKRISCQLEILRLGVPYDGTYLDANRWEQLIKKQLSHLEKFYFKYGSYADSPYDLHLDYTILDRFTSSFWIQRKWFSELKIDDNEMFFSIYPYKKDQFDSYEYMKTNIHPIRLVIEGDTNIEQIQSLIKTIKSSCLQIQFTSLNIHCYNLTIVSLLEIIRLLPHLYFLELSSLPDLVSYSSSVENIKNQLLVSVMNRVVKLKLNKFTDRTEIQFLLNICSRMQYFELDCTKNTDLGMLIKYILLNQVTHTPNLGFVCLNIPDADANTIRNFRKIIQFETSVTNYTLQRIGEKIFLQWKLE